MAEDETVRGRPRRRDIGFLEGYVLVWLAVPLAVVVVMVLVSSPSEGIGLCACIAGLVAWRRRRSRVAPSADPAERDRILEND
jgi:predicted metal-binding membrane protein